jgi:hypothetical protein
MRCGLVWISTAVFILFSGAHSTAFAQTALKLPSPQPFSSLGYDHIKTKYGVRVYKHRKSAIIKLGADGVIRAPPADVSRFLLDYGKQIGVIDRLVRARVLSRRGKTLRVYQRLDLPWISDRDFTLDVRWGKSGSAHWIRYRADPRGPGGKKGAVHVKTHHGRWLLVPLQNGKATRVRFEVTIDMGGWLPRWMAKAGAGKEVPNLFRNVQRAVKQRINARRKTSCTGS